MSTPLDRSTGIILKISDYKDNAVLLTVLVSGVGQLRLIGKGQLKQSSKLAPICQPFNELLMSYYRKEHTSLGQLINATVVNSRVDLSFNIYQSIYGQILCELIEKITFDDEHDVDLLYEFLNESLDSLFMDNVHDAMAFALVRLITVLGYQIQFIDMPLDYDSSTPFYIDLGNGSIKANFNFEDMKYPLSQSEVITLLAYSQMDSYDQNYLEAFDSLGFDHVRFLLDFIHYHMGLSLKTVGLLETL